MDHSTAEPQLHRDGPPALSGAIVAIGAFDGVHRGHQRLIAGTVAAARRCGVPAVIWTFDPPPKVHFGRAALILPLAARLARIGFFQPDHIVVDRFDEVYRSRSADDFLAGLARVNPIQVRVGADFRFGAGQAGDVALLARHFHTRVEPPHRCAAGEVISSTRIRGLLRTGDLAAAEALHGWGRLLGRGA